MTLRTSSFHRQHILTALVAGLFFVGTGTANAYILRTQVLNRAPFGRYKNFYVAPSTASPRLVRLVTHTFETLSYERVRALKSAQFVLRISVQRKLMQFRQPVPYYGAYYGYDFEDGDGWGGPWEGYPFCCAYGPSWEGGFYVSPAYAQAYRLVTRPVRVILIVATSGTGNIPVWRGTAITRIRNRAALWAIVWHLVNLFPIL